MNYIKVNIYGHDDKNRIQFVKQINTQIKNVFRRIPSLRHNDAYRKLQLECARVLRGDSINQLYVGTKMLAYIKTRIPKNTILR